MITGTGWTQSQLEETSLSVVWDLLKHWRDFPPSHILLRGFVGWQGSEQDPGRPFELPPELGDAPINRNLPDAVRADIEALRKNHAATR